jgi:AcrR family transcriptional regulator
MSPGRFKRRPADRLCSSCVSTLYALTVYSLRRTVYGVKRQTGTANEMANEEADAGRAAGELPWWPSPEARRAVLAARRRDRREPRSRTRSGAGRERTTPDAIVAAAVAIIDREGLDALTVRGLAAELGVAPMTVYSYVESKEELLDLVVDRVAADIAVPPAQGDWRGRARALAHGLRTTLLAHPDGARLISERPVRSPNAFRLFDAGLGIFRSAGFPDAQAAYAYFAFGNYVMGCAAQDTAAIRAMRTAASQDATTPAPAEAVQLLPADRFPNVHALARYVYGEPGGAPAPDRSRDEAFDFGLDCLLDGLAARLPPKNDRL